SSRSPANDAASSAPAARPRKGSQAPPSPWSGRATASSARRPSPTRWYGPATPAAETGSREGDAVPSSDRSLKVSRRTGETAAMTNAAVLKRSLPARRLVGLIAALTALCALALPAVAAARPSVLRLPKPAVLTFKVAKVGQPGNHAVAIVPFTSALYANCSEAPANPTAPGTKLPDPCQEVGSVGYEYGIGEVEVTVEQYVAFLNTVDPFGRNQMNLYSPDESGTAWPRFGQIDYSALARTGQHYTAAAPEWNDKPYGFANFLRAARFDNSVANGKVLSKTESSSGSGSTEFKYVTYRVALSRKTGTGMYDMHKRAPVRTSESGFVIPSQNEWIKDAYF